MNDTYIVAQGPGKALKIVDELNTMVDGDMIPAPKDVLKRADEASRVFTSMIKAMSKEEILALQTSFVSLQGIVTILHRGIVQYIDDSWGIESIETLS